MGNENDRPPIIPYATPMLVASRRPGAVTTLAIIGILLGILGVYGDLFDLVQYLDMLPGESLLAHAVEGNGALLLWAVLSTMVGVSLGIILLSGSIGALSLRHGTRRLLVLYGWTAIALHVLRIVVVVGVMLPELDASDRETMAVRGLAGTSLELIYSCFLLLYMYKPHVVEAFGELACCPVPVTVIANAGVIIALVRMLSALAVFLTLHFIVPIPESSLIRLFRRDRMLHSWSIIGVVLSLAIGGFLLFGCLRAHSLRRRVLLCAGWAAIAFDATCVVVVFGHIAPSVSKLPEAMQSAWPVLLGLDVIYSILLLICMYKPHVARAFDDALR